MSEPRAPRIRLLAANLPPPASRAAHIGRGFALVIATVGPLAAGIALIGWDIHGPAALWVPAVALWLSALLAHHRHSGSQLVARSVWWANLVLGFLLSIAGGSSESLLGLFLVLGTGAPLLAMGRLGLDEDPESAFRPVAFRSVLALGMIMAVADAQALVFWGVLKVTRESWNEGTLTQQQQGVILLAAAALLLVALVGLYRLRVWGLLLGSACAAGLIALAASDVCGLRSPLPQSLIATSAVQLLLPIPIFVAIARGRAPEPRAPSRIARAAPAIVIVLLMGVSAYSTLVMGGNGLP